MESDHAIHAVAFLQDLATVMLIAGGVTVLFHRLRQPVVLGYIIAGVIIGPHTPPYLLVHDQGTIHVLAEIGVVFLMFSLGLEFSLRKLRQVGATAFIAALLEIATLLAVGYGIGRAFGWSLMDSLFLGALISISSTTIIIKALAELGKMKEGFAQIIFGILIVEDLLGILLIALLSGIAMTGTAGAARGAGSGRASRRLPGGVRSSSGCWSSRGCCATSPVSTATRCCSSPCWRCASAGRSSR